MLHADRPWGLDSPGAQLCQQLLDQDPSPFAELVGAVGPLGAAPYVGVRAREVDTHGRASVHTHDHDFVSAFEMSSDRAGDATDDATAMPPEGQCVVLLTDSPKAVEAGEPELGAGHLRQLPALLA